MILKDKLSPSRRVVCCPEDLKLELNVITCGSFASRLVPFSVKVIFTVPSVAGSGNVKSMSAVPEPPEEGAVSTGGCVPPWSYRIAMSAGVSTIL